MQFERKALKNLLLAKQALYKAIMTYKRCSKLQDNSVLIKETLFYITEVTVEIKSFCNIMKEKNNE